MWMSRNVLLFSQGLEAREKLMEQLVFSQKFFRGGGGRQNLMSCKFYRNANFPFVVF